MHAPLIILCPPRSFSSVVSTIIGEHPQIYGFPELHLFAADTVEEIICQEARANRPAPAGLLRTLAQEHDGVQTTRTILRAIVWLNERRDWSTKALFDYLLDLVNPKIGVEKSPITSLNNRFLERAYRAYPNAYFLHLVRHPVSARKSIQEFFQERGIPHLKGIQNPLETAIDPLLTWYNMHSNIMTFTSTLPMGQSMRIKGENLLSEPEIYLPQIAQWIGLPFDENILRKMMHPENSPYACVGPVPARGGNDSKFMRSPKMRHGRVKEPSLEKFFEDHPNFDWVVPKVLEQLKDAPELLTSRQSLNEELFQLAHIFGYQ